MERQAKDGTFYKQVGPDQWSPVTREAKDGTVYKKVGDDQWSPVNQKAEQQIKQEDTPWYQVQNETGKNIIKSVLNTLPAAGGLLGAAVGTPADIVAGPLGTVAGAAAGGALGKSIQNIGEKYLLNENKDYKQTLLDPITSGAEMAASEMGGQVLGKGISKLTDTQAAKYIADKASKTFEPIGNGLSKVGELFTGVPTDEIKTYAKYSDDIKKLAKSSDNNTYEAANILRDNWNKSIQSTKGELGSQISSALKNNKSTVEIAPVIDELNVAKSKINEKLYPEQIQQVDDLISKIKSLSTDGKVDLSSLNDVKAFLQDKASSAYGNNGIFSLGTQASKSAKSGAAVARSVLNKSEPLIESANNKLSQLHDIEDSINLNMLKDTKPEASIIAAGNGGNYRNAKGLQELSDLTNSDMIGDAKKLAAMRTFGSPKLMAADATGKAAGRMGLAAGIGFVTGGPTGAVIASGLTSPFALRSAIDTGKFTGEMFNNLVSSDAGRQLLAKALLPNIKNEANQDKIETIPDINNKLTNSKGPDKWADDGANQLQNHDSSLDKETLEKLKQSKKGRALLEKASMYKAGDKQLDRIATEIKSMTSEAN